MNKRNFTKVVAAVMSVLMVISTMPFLTSAVDFDTAATGDYFAVISENKYNLCNGATETELVLNNADGNDRKVVHYFEVDTKNSNIEVLPGYYGIDKLDPNNLALDGIVDKSQYWKAMELTKTVAYYESMGYNVVGAMNTALAYDSNAPYGYMVMNGVVLGTPEVHKGAQTYLAIDAEGNCELRSMSTPLDGSEVTAISANFGWLVKDGELVAKSVERTSSDASRSMIGIRADGSLVFCQVDGRNAPVSTGLSNYEMGEMMLALGCVNAVNCDGGGSSTFVSKREGESSNTMRSVPSDGSERPTINSVIIVSKAKATGEFDHAVLKTDYEFYAPGSSAIIKPQGVDSAGSPAELPTEGITWDLSDASFGTIANGVFVSNGKKGDVSVEMYYNGEKVGDKTVHVVDPDSFALALDETVLPYGKTMTIDFDCTYGVDDWAVCVDGAYALALSDTTAATLNGNVLVATKDESIAGVDVIATYLPNPAVTDTLQVIYGKGSEIVFDFEDGDISKFLGVDEMYDWAEDVGASAPIQSNGNYSTDADSFTFLSTDVVRNGKYSLGVTLDYTAAQFASWSYNMFFYTGAPTVLRDIANGQNATTFGMWVYIPEGAAGLAMQQTVYQGPSAEKAKGSQLHFYFTTVSGAKKNLNSCTEADIPESRWVYATADLTANNYVSFVDPMASSYGREPCFIRFYVKPTTAANLTFYFDDFTLDYSSAVDDRVLPTINVPTYTTADEGVVLENGAVINGNTITFTATVSDNVKLDNTTGKIYVDGNLLPNCTVSGKFLVADAVTLTAGAHTVAFEVKDALGNPTRITRTFTVAGDANMTLGGHNDSGLMPEYGSVYYVDINTANIANINKLTAKLKLQTANTWEPQGTVVAKGFKFSYELNQVEGVLTITIERNGEAVDASATILASIPVRLWTWDGVNHVTDVPVTPETQYATGNNPVVRVQCTVAASNITFADGSKILGSFNGNIDVETKINDVVYKWHYHDVELTSLNKAVTCTEDGYEGRTYCETCKSVVNWGTIYHAAGHEYKVVDGKLFCDCGEAVTSSGIIEIDGNIYYAVAGKLATGWIADGDVYYYMDKNTYVAYKSGRYTIDGFDYSFDENGIHTEGQWVYLFYEGQYSTRYTFAGKYVVERFHEIDGKTYYFGSYGILAKGTQVLQLTDGVNNKYIYVIDENGVVEGVLDHTGVYNLNGTLYYVVDGKLTGSGVKEVDGVLYYVEWNGVIPTGKIYIVEERTNGLVEKGWYYIDENGFINNEFFTIDGTVHYVVNGQPAKGLGVINVKGNLYYVNGMGVVETGKIYVPADLTNDLVNVGYVYTDETGRIYNDEFVEIDGKILYVVNGQPVKSGASLVKEMDDGLYFVEWNGNIPTGKVYVSADQTNGLTGEGWHYTDAIGRFYDNEFVNIDGAVYYMVDGMIERTGVTSIREINGNLYYVEWNGQVATGKFYIEDKYAGEYTTAGWHYTDETGRFYNNEIVAVEDGLYYIVNGKIDRTGVTSVRVLDGDMYYVEWNGKVAVGKTYVEDKYANGLTTSGWHYTDEIGRFYNNEIVAVEDGLYYIVNGKIDRTGRTSVREIDGGLYYIEWNGKVAVGKTYVEDKYANGLTISGWHYTDETGCFYDNEFAMIEGKIFYMVNGQADRTGVSSIREINGAFYYIEWNGQVAIGKVYTEDGWRYTDENGKFYNNEFVEINGDLYFMVDGATYKNGVFLFEGNLYYAAWNGKIARDGRDYVDVSQTNGLIIYGYHTFDADGKMIG